MAQVQPIVQALLFKLPQVEAPLLWRSTPQQFLPSSATLLHPWVIIWIRQVRARCWAEVDQLLNSSKFDINIENQRFTQYHIHYFRSMSEADINKDPKQPSSSTRNERLKQIDALYHNQLQQLQTDKSKSPSPPAQAPKKQDFQHKTVEPKVADPSLSRVRSYGSLLGKNKQSSRLLPLGLDQDGRTSMFLKGDSTKTIEGLRRQNETKELRIRQLSSKCEGLIARLKQFVPNQDLQNELDSLRDISADKSERLERLFKIKTEEIFFKLKVQVVGLLQEFGVSREELSQSNQIKSQTQLFTFMSRKLKSRLKDFRHKEAESTFSSQKDRIVNQKQEERIHFLTETNQLLKLNQTKLKGKIQDLKNQMNEYIDKLRDRQQQNEERQTEFFKLRKQNQQLQTVNQKLNTAVRGAQGEKSEERRNWQAREKQLKQLLANYNVDKQKLEVELEERGEQIEEKSIRMRFLEQENERVNREIVRWKERFEGLEKDKQLRIKQVEEQKSNLMNQFEEYKSSHNDGVTMEAKGQVEEAFKRIQEYQLAYQQVLEQLEEERRLLQLAEQQNQERVEAMERQWLARVKKLQRSKDEALTELTKQTELRQAEFQLEFQQKEMLLAEQLQARLKAQLAERDKRNTEQLIRMEGECDELRREVDSLNKMLEVKESLINVLNGKKMIFQ